MKGRTTLSLPLQVVLWALANSAAGAATGLAVAAFQPGGIEVPVIAISVLFGNVVGFTALVASLVLFPRLRRFPQPVRVTLLGLALISGAVAGTLIVVGLFPLYILRDLRLTVAVFAITGVLALIVGGVVYVYESLRRRLADSLREVEEVRLVEARLKEQAARAELAALQARINPHFFFNTLNTISSLLEDDPSGAERIVHKLSRLFRYTLKVSGAAAVPLEEELGFVEDYLSIEQARFGERLAVRWEIEPAARDVPVPGLVLQPLVENAVGHGVAPSEAGGTVRILARKVGSELEVRVEDDGNGLRLSPHDVFREGHGLANVRQRLLALYRERGLLTLSPGDAGRGCVARVRLPLDDAAGPPSLTEAAAALEGNAR